MGGYVPGYRLGTLLLGVLRFGGMCPEERFLSCRVHIVGYRSGVFRVGVLEYSQGGAPRQEALHQMWGGCTIGYGARTLLVDIL